MRSPHNSTDNNFIQYHIHNVYYMYYYILFTIAYYQIYWQYSISFLPCQKHLFLTNITMPINLVLIPPDEYIYLY